AGMRPQALAPRGVWQGSRLVPGGRWALLGCTVTPGFEYADYAHGRTEELAAAYPEHAARIRALGAEGRR
ncbi:MAG: cupin domain-containing protein, partial [Desulfovibrionaceae bacterium]